MKIFKELCMPNWLIKNFPTGEEDQTLSEIIVPTGIFTILGTSIVCYNFFTTEWRYLALLFALMAIFICTVFIYWLSVQTELLKKKREKN